MKQPYPSFTETEIGDGHKTENSSHCILTPTTRAAISMLHDIASHRFKAPLEPSDIETIQKLLPLLTVAGIIRPLSQAKASLFLNISDYELARKVQEVSLLQILEATSEHLNCNNETSEDLYIYYQLAASKLGIINYMTRLYLSEIKLSDL